MSVTVDPRFPSLPLHEREALDGPRFVAWLEAEGEHLGDIRLGYHARAVRHWRSGEPAQVYEADKVLTKVGLHLHLIPDDLWIESKRKPRYIPTRSKRGMS